METNSPDEDKIRQKIYQAYTWYLENPVRTKWSDRTVEFSEIYDWIAANKSKIKEYFDI